MKKRSPESGISLAPIPPRSRYLRRRRFEMLALWYGSERAEREIASHTTTPQSIGTLVENVLAGIQRPENSVLIKMKNKWSFFVGSSFARYTEPAALNNGVLTLKVRHSALLMELQYSVDLIQSRINNEFGENCCREIRLTVK